MSGRLVFLPVTVTSSAMAKWLAAGFAPVDQVNGDGVFANSGADPGAVAKQAVDLAVGVVERLATAEGGGLVELVEGFGD